MEREGKDIELKFDGATIKQLGGAPAESVIGALYALQRLVYLIGMKNEGRIFGQRAKPSNRVRQEFSIICRPAEHGSHIQPFDVGSTSGQFAASSVYAREQLLKTLKAFNTGDAEAVKAAIPDARERWFLASAASGLIPSQESGIEITIRPGQHGPFSFKAGRARALVDQFSSGSPPQAGPRAVSGKLHSIDFTNSIINVKPSGSRQFRIGYNASSEPMLKANGRKRLVINGLPNINAAGDVTGFERVDSISESDTSMEPIDGFDFDGQFIYTNRPIRVISTYDNENGVYIYQDFQLGIDVWSETYNKLRSSVLQELQMLWASYALERDDNLDEEARLVKKSLINRFKDRPDAA